jgi:hypothetical protein
MRMHYVRSLLLAIAMLFVSTAAFAQVSVSVTTSHSVRVRAIFGRRAIGLGTVRITTGCQAHGCSRRKLVICGLHRIGPGAVLLSFFMTAIGDPWWVSMAELTTGSATSDTVS